MTTRTNPRSFAPTSLPVRIAVVLIALAGCSRKDASLDEARSVPEAPPVPTNQVPIPSHVRSNLGISFAKVERRAVANTIRVPGRFELMPDARNDVRAPVAGRVEVLVHQHDAVAAGTPLVRIDSAQWRDLQRELADAESAIKAAAAEERSFGPLREAHAVHENSLFETTELWRERVAQLEKVSASGGGVAESLALARATLSSTAAEYADVREKDAQLDARQLTVTAAREAATTRFELLLATAATLLSVDRESLLGSDPATGRPRWQTIATVDLAARSAGVVLSIERVTGTWVEESAIVVTVIDPRRLRLRAHGLQSDLLRFADGQECAIVPASSGDLESHASMRGTLRIGSIADPESRSIDLFTEPHELAPWARAGVTAFLEVTTKEAKHELAIPRTAVARDGLVPVIFRRSPRDPDSAIRLEADLGLDDGRFVVVNSGVTDGDEVVVDGVYQLMLATSGSAQKGGHFHADGTFHADGDH